MTNRHQELIVNKKIKDDYPLISVIVPTRNEEKIIERCLKSIKNQNYKNFELIVVDNNSSDRTKEISLKYADKFYNYGDERSSQKNFGMKNASGKYIFILDADQEFPDNNFLRDITEEIRGKDALFVYGRPIGLTFWARAHSFEKIIHYNNPKLTSPKFFKKNKVLELGGFDENLVVSEDSELFMRMKEAGLNFGYSKNFFNDYEGGGLFDAFKKNSYYGRTAGAFLKKTKSKGWKIHLIYHPLAYIKNWKYFLKHPIYGTASIIRVFVKYLGGLYGMMWKFFDKTKYRLIRAIITNEPSYLIFFITSRCNSKCKHCFYWKELNKNNDEISLSNIEKISKGFSNLIYLNITGGEPFLRDDIDKICFFFYKNSGTKFISISTNGSLPEKIKEKSKNILNSCRDAKLNISISLDELGKKHDEFRGTEGSFNKVLESVKYLKELKKENPRLRIIISSSFSKENQDRIIQLYNYVKDLDISYHRVGLIRPGGRDNNLINFSLKKYEEFIKYKNENDNKKDKIELLEMIHKMNIDVNLRTIKENRMILPCIAGRKFLVIKENGKVLPCEILNKDLGDLKDFNYNINNLLKSEDSKKCIKQIKRDKCFCSWGCATQNNIIFNKRNYFEIIKNYIAELNKLKNLGEK